jgi:hypothetical protein
VCIGCVSEYGGGVGSGERGNGPSGSRGGGERFDYLSNTSPEVRQPLFHGWS